MRRRAELEGASTGRPFESEASEERSAWLARTPRQACSSSTNVPRTSPRKPTLETVAPLPGSQRLTLTDSLPVLPFFLFRTTMSTSRPSRRPAAKTPRLPGDHQRNLRWSILDPEENLSESAHFAKLGVARSRGKTACVDAGTPRIAPPTVTKKKAPVTVGNQALLTRQFPKTSKERAMGLEPTTSSLGSWHSTN